MRCGSALQKTLLNKANELSVSNDHVVEQPNAQQLGGIAQTVADQVEACVEVEARVTVLGHLQRGGGPTAFDRWLATRFGVAALELLAVGQTGQMVALQGTRITSVPINDAVAQLRRVDPQGEEVQTARAVGTSFGD